MYSRLPEDEALGSKYVEDIINLKNYNINFANVPFVGLYCTYFLMHLVGLVHMDRNIDAPQLDPRESIREISHRLHIPHS
jgi:heme/copper-type cytochrome/quinol oxidase subunit 1